MSRRIRKKGAIPRIMELEEGWALGHNFFSEILSGPIGGKAKNSKVPVMLK